MRLYFSLIHRFLDGRRFKNIFHAHLGKIFHVVKIPCSIRVENMNKIWISIILIMSLMGFASALDGSGVDYGIDSTYSQYYSIYNGPATAKHIEAPRQYVVGDVTPTTVYLGSQMQAVPHPQYYATYTGGNSLWIQGSASWTQYAKVPQGSPLSLLAFITNWRRRFSL